MSSRVIKHLGSLLWRDFPTADAALGFFGRRLPPTDGEGIVRVARGESLLVRMTAPRPIDWARRPIVTCESRGDAGVHLFLADLDLAAATFQGVVANIEATRGRRPRGVELWRIEEWSPPSSMGAKPTPRH